jgi:hypothetical protein
VRLLYYFLPDVEVEVVVKLDSRVVGISGKVMLLIDVVDLNLYSTFELHVRGYGWDCVRHLIGNRTSLVPHSLQYEPWLGLRFGWREGVQVIQASMGGFLIDNVEKT